MFILMVVKLNGTFRSRNKTHWNANYNRLGGEMGISSLMHTVNELCVDCIKSHP